MGNSYGSKHYSKRELAAIKVFIDQNNLSKKPLSLRRLSLVVAKELKRAHSGVYIKMLGMCISKPTYQKVNRKVDPTSIAVTKSMTFSKPTKIDITDTGMTFYFN